MNTLELSLKAGKGFNEQEILKAINQPNEYVTLDEHGETIEKEDSVVDYIGYYTNKLLQAD